MSEEEYVSDAFIYLKERRLPYQTFDADNHMYETPEAMTKFIPPEFEGVIKYVDINGRTKLALRDKISEYIPNPTFNRVAPPGGAGADPQHRRAVPSVEAFFDPEPRLALMKDMGIDRALMWPTLASAVEERLADDPDACLVVIRALNRWMLEHWSYNYADAIYSTPIITLAAGNDEAIRELDFIVENGAKCFLLRVAPVPTWKGRKSFALPEFDPFWERVVEHDILVGMHSGDAGYQRYTNEWEGLTGEMLPFKRGGSPAFQRLSSEKSNVIDAMASIIGHGLATRFPTLRFAPTEFGTEWVRPFVRKLQAAYEATPVIFDEDPYEVFKRNIFVHVWHDPDPKGLAELIGVDNVMFGSDFPHPEGMADPLGYSELVEQQLSAEDAAKVMGGNLARIMRVSV